jgi:hypothetical protein
MFGFFDCAVALLLSNPIRTIPAMGISQRRSHFIGTVPFPATL